MSKGIIETIAGGLEIAGGIALEVLSAGGSTPLSSFLITSGAGLVLSGIGTMLTKGPVQGFATTTRNPIAPWEVIYGRARVGGTIVYLAEFGDSNKYLDMVIVLAAHQCESVDEVLFDNQRLQIGANNTSFTPVQQNLNINNTTDITRVGNVVTVQNVTDIPLLTDGDRLLIEGVHPVSLGLNGIFPVFQVIHNSPPGTVQFSYLCGGLAIPPATISESGRVHTQWQDYKKNVYVESIGDSGSYNRLGHQQTLGETFVGMTNGTPHQGDPTNLTQNDANGNNPWTNFCSLVGMTAVHIRLEYDSSLFPGGIPQISFLVRGKNDIQDPRTSPPTRAYTENSALCIADYLSQPVWGFKADFNSEIDIPQLIAAANICDEGVGLAFPLTSPLTTEPRYTCCGHFNVSVKRGEVLQNLLTSCAGRVTYIGGKFGIWPAAWTGSSLALSDDWVKTNAAGAIRWRSSVSISNLYNGVKGTYISPVNNWQSSDFPRYAQDADHGYNDGDPGDEYDLNLENDGGDRRWKDIQLPFTISCPTAQRLAKIELMRIRQQGTGTFLLNMAGYQIAPLDLLSMTFGYFGWTGKYLEVQATRFKLDRQSSEGGEAVLIGTEIDVQETDPSVYDWELIEELSPQGYQHPGVPNSVFTPDPPSNLVIAVDQGVTVLRWTAPLDAYVTRIEGQYRIIASPEGIWVALPTVAVTVTQISLAPLLDSGEYEIQLRSVNGAGVSSDWVTLNFVPEPFQQKIHPNIETPNAADPLFDATDLTFGLSQVYTLGKDNKYSVDLIVKTQLPVDSPIPGSIAPVVGTAAAVSAMGGVLTPGAQYIISIACYDNSDITQRHYTASSDLLTVTMLTGCDAVELSDITWPTGTFAGYTIFAVQDDETQICAQASVDGALPSTITLLGPLELSTFNMPTTVVEMPRVKACVLVRAGVFSAPCTAVDSTSITLGVLAGLADDWTGRELLLTSKLLDHPFPIASFHISAYNTTTGKATVTPDPTALVSDGSSPPNLTQTVEVGDVLAICFAPDNITDVTIGDTKLINDLFPLGEGSDPTLRRGNTIVAWKKKTNERQIRRVISSTATVYTVDQAFDPIPDSTWAFILAWGAWPFQADYGDVENAIAGTTVNIPVGVNNTIAQNYLVILSALDTRGGETSEVIVAQRIIHLNGRGNQVTNVSTSSPPVAYMVQSTDQTVCVDATLAPQGVILPADVGLLGQSWTIANNADSVYDVTVTVAGAGGTITVFDVTSSSDTLAPGEVALLLRLS